MSDVTVEYNFYGQNLEAYYCKDPEVILAGPADTGKTLMWLARLNALAMKYDNASFVILRQQLTDMHATVLQTFENEVIHDALEMGIVTKYGGKKAQWYDYKKTETRIWVAGLDKPGKVLSGQHDIVVFFQAEEGTLAGWEHLLSRTTGRAGNLPWNQTVGDCNPGPPSHWIQRRKKDGLLTFFESRHRDNPAIFDQETGDITERGVNRMDGLRRLTGSRKQRLFHGLWVAPEGAIYEVFEEARHVVKSFPIPQLWPRTVGVDPVGAHVAAVWLAWDPQAQVLNVYREYAAPFGVPTRKHVENVKELSRNESIHAWVVGAVSERQPRQDWIDAGVPAIPPPYADVWVGIDKVNELLGESRMFIHDSCPGLISDIGDYHRKMGKDGEPTDVIEGKEKYHLADALRYSVAWLTAPQTGTVRVGYTPTAIGERRY